MDSTHCNVNLNYNNLNASQISLWCEFWETPIDDLSMFDNVAPLQDVQPDSSSLPSYTSPLRTPSPPSLSPHPPQTSSTPPPSPPAPSNGDKNMKRMPNVYLEV